MSDLVSRDSTQPSPEFLRSVAEKIAARRRELQVAAASAGVSRESANANDAKVQQRGATAYEQAAAVLAWFDPATLRPLDEEPDRKQLDELVKQSVQTADRDGRLRWTLPSNQRVAALAQLRAAGKIPAALAANERPADPIQESLDSYLLKQAKPIERQTLSELASSHQVCGWLRAAGFTSLPTAEELVRRTDWLALLNPFEHVAGDDRFRGRQKELSQLREYAGVLPPDTPLGAARRVFEKIFNLTEKPPLLIVGVGGVGKSTLIGRFILEHARAQETYRFPFAYLDFDRPEVDAREPLTLLVEAVRQLGIEYPHARAHCEGLRRAWTEQAVNARELHAPQAITFAIRDFASLIDTLGGNEQPVLFVLDTFEEVQWRSASSVETVWGVLEQLQAAVPRLRVVLVGRADIPGKATQTLILTGLDFEAAVRYLQVRGIEDEVVAERVARQIGGSPLSLQLAAELYQREGADKKGQLSVGSRTHLFFRLDSNLLQQQLYSRVLEHVHDPKVRKLAHPGLILRRITADLILNVLAKPCGVPVRSEREAVRLFEALKREVALVKEEPDGAVRHRRDLRLVMLELLRADDLAKVRAIHEAAIDYYARRAAAPVERAEEIYHRLSLDQPLEQISGRWMAGIEPYIATALEEFTGRRRAWLASRLQLDIDAETRQLADIEDWESIAVRDAEQFIEHGEGGRALEMIRARSDRRASSPLAPLEVKALVQLRRREEALQVANRGFEAAIAAGNRAIAVTLALQAADIVLASSPHPPSIAESVLGRLKLLLEGRMASADKVAALARSVALLATHPTTQKSADPLRRHLRKAFDALSDEEIGADPTLARWAIAVLESQDAKRIARGILLCGLPRGLDAELRALAVALTALDVSESDKSGEAPGMLARKLHIPIVTSLTVAWADFLIRAPEQRVRENLAALFNEYADQLPPAVAKGTADLMRASLGVSPAEPVTAAPAVQRPRAVRSGLEGVDPQSLAGLMSALADAFDRKTFAEFLLYRLNRNLQAISFADTLSSTMYDVVRTAFAQGWLGELVTRALQARPNNALLQEIAARLGVGKGLRESAAIFDNMGSIDIRRFRQATARIAVLNVAGQAEATAFLVGPDLILTSGHALEKVYAGHAQGSDVSLLFDAEEDASVPGERFSLESDWLVDETSEYALLRVAQAPGAQPIGGSRAESSAQLRQWFELTDDPRPLQPGDQGIVISRAIEPGGRASLALTRVDVKAIDAEGLLVLSGAGPVGSAGAPCFNRNLELVGMITTIFGDEALCAPIASIRAQVQNHGLFGSLGTAFA